MAPVTIAWRTSLSEIPDDVLSEITADGHTFSSAEWYRLLDRLELSTITGGKVRLLYAVVELGSEPIGLCPVLWTQGTGVYFAYSIRRYFFEHWREETQRTRVPIDRRCQRLLSGIAAYQSLLEWSHAPLDECLIVGSPLSFRGHIPVAVSSTIPRDVIYQKIVQFLLRQSRRLHLPLWFHCVPSTQGRLSSVLSDHGCQPVFLCYDNVVEVDGFRHFGDYLQSLRRPARRAVCRELARCERGDIDFTLADDLAEISDELADIHARSHGPPRDTFLRQPREFWNHTARAFGPRAEAIIARRGDDTVGFHALLRNERRGEIWAYRMGRLPTPSLRQFAIPSMLGFHEPIRRAIALGYRRVWLGPAFYEAKALRGARRVPLYGYFWFPRRWDRWCLQPYLEKFGEVSRQQIELVLNRPRRFHAVAARSTPVHGK